MVEKKRLLWLLYPVFLLMTLTPLLIATWHYSHTLRSFYIREIENDMSMKADLMKVYLADHISEEGASRADLIIESFAKRFGNRITVILADGTTIADSDGEEQRADRSDRPEVITAMTGRTGAEQRFSNTIGTDMLYVAVPVRRQPPAAENTGDVFESSEGPVVGIIRVAVPLHSVNQTLRNVYARMALGGLLVAVATALVSLLVSRRITRPIENLRRGAERFAAGDLRHKLAVPDTREIGSLAEAMNLMAVQLNERIDTMLQQKNHLEALLTSMVEGVLAVDNNKRLTSINETAAGLFGVDVRDVRGQTIQHAVRNTKLIEFLDRILTSSTPGETELVLRRDDGREVFVQAHGAVLRDSQDLRIGAVVVLNDLTRLRRLERVRRDFVANVSHELKTPITSIKGFVETLQDGALSDPEAADRFLGIIGRQADRLAAIIDDLLSLSRIEQEEKVVLTRECCNVTDLLTAAVEVCQAKADARKMTITANCPAELQVNANAPLIEQAVINLLDNAIQYSPEQGTVSITALPEDRSVAISVRDYGCGISEKHLSRIFERFYRVDKARSRTLGGTGLGLSIVKHIVQLHSGTLSVESSPGKGSVFTIRLPLA